MKKEMQGNGAKLPKRRSRYQITLNYRSCEHFLGQKVPAKMSLVHAKIPISSLFLSLWYRIYIMVTCQTLHPTIQDLPSLV